MDIARAHDIDVFQSTLPRRQRHLLLRRNRCRSKFQSTLPRRQRLQLLQPQDTDISISIYATAKAATWCEEKCLPCYGNFNLRYREGSDGNLLILPVPGHYFNLRYREGSDYDNVDIYALYIISIYATAKAATKKLFNSGRLTEFQSTLPRRQRHVLLGHCVMHMPISIYATAKAATQGAIEDELTFAISIYATAKAATSFHKARIKLVIISIYATAKAATGLATEAIAGIADFNLRYREGSDIIGDVSSIPNSIFQSTLPRRQRRLAKVLRIM